MFSLLVSVLVDFNYCVLCWCLIRFVRPIYGVCGVVVVVVVVNFIKHQNRAITGDSCMPSLTFRYIYYIYVWCLFLSPSITVENVIIF